MTNHKRINVTFDDETYYSIMRLAALNNQSMSDIVRSFAEEGLNGKLNQNNIDFISTIIREQLKNVMQPQVERLASLSAKTCVEAATSAYLTAETIAKFVPLEEQEPFQDVYEKARKKAIATTRNKNGEQ